LKLRKNFFSAWFFILLGCFSVFFLLKTGVFLGWLGNRNVASVYFSHREYRLGEGKIRLFIATENCYRSDGETSAEEVLTKLADFFFYQSAAGQLNVKVNREEIIAEAKRIDEETKAPDILACVKKAFGRNREDYLTYFVSPSLYNRKVHSAFNLSVSIHKEAIEKIEAVKAEVFKKPEKFETIGRSRGNFESSAYPPKEKNTTPEILIPYGFGEKTDYAENPFVKNVLSRLKLGEIFPNVVEDDYSYKLVKLLSSEKGNDGVTRYRFEAITVAKRSFDEWFREINKDVTIKICDKSLYEKIMVKYPAVWWLPRLSFGKNC
jgi:hypothetical protein